MDVGRTSSSDGLAVVGVGQLHLLLQARQTLRLRVPKPHHQPWRHPHEQDQVVLTREGSSSLSGSAAIRNSTCLALRVKSSTSSFLFAVPATVNPSCYIKRGRGNGPSKTASSSASEESSEESSSDEVGISLSSALEKADQSVVPLAAVEDGASLAARARTSPVDAVNVAELLATLALSCVAD